MHAKRFQACSGRIWIFMKQTFTWALLFGFIVDAIFCSTCFALPSSHNNVVHGNTKANRRRAKQSRENNYSWSERMNKRQCANNQNQTKRQKSLFVCRRSTICAAACVCVYANSNRIRKYVQFAGWIRSSLNWGNNARNRYRSAVCAFVHWFAGWTFFTSLISTAAPAWFVFARYIFIIYLQIIMESNKNISRKLHP